MNTGFLKTVASFVYPVTLERFRTVNGEKGVVLLIEGKPSIRVDGILESGPWLRWSWGKAIRMVARKAAKPSRVLLLGAAGGDIIRAVKRAWGGDVHVDAVDIDREIIRIGKTYFGLDKIPKLSLITDDAERYVRKAASGGIRYDCIILDVFNGENVPPFVLSDGFLRNLHACLTAKGFLLANASFPDPEGREDGKMLLDNLSSIYHSVRSIRIHPNTILFAQ